MTDRGRKSAAVWGVAGWGLGVLALLVALPPAASGRLPDRLATHWDAGSGRPDGSMPLWAAGLFPALIWAVLVVVVAVAMRRAGAGAGSAIPGWAAAGLGFGAVMLVGVQASIVRANLDRADWHEADSVTGWVVGTLVVAVMGGAICALAAFRGPAGPRKAAQGPAMAIPAGQRLVWLSRTSNPWLHAISAVTGLLAIAAVVTVAAGLTDLPFVLAAGPFALACVLVLGCSSVQARVSEQGLEVALGPFGWPMRRWAADDITAARAEDRTPAQVGGWGYRLSGLGTTVMLRSGQCLVIRSKNGKEFAVSVDDAERGAALLNSLGVRHAE
ncbi:DUF1648 domain-containing protein [Streptomyces sp. NPDC021212]|uniref:DUF1648 domain-containing protein n=1 Tax=Streptomyces sp. NPDC021212 TaxID=3365118 RepID=UPI0037A1025C